MNETNTNQAVDAQAETVHIKKKYNEDFAVDELKLLNAEELSFSKEESGFMTLHYNGDSFEEVSLVRLAPFYEEDRFISVSFRDKDKEWHEIGVINDVAELTEEQRAMVQDYLEYRYFIPVITKIHTITDNRMGYLFIDADTTAGRKRISVKDWWSNFRLRENGALTVTDADGNRYIVPQFADMDRKSMRKLQLFI
jgi:hypothetical protein